MPKPARSCLLAVALLACCSALVAADASRRLFELPDEVRESSGLAAASFRDDLYFTLNDSGGKPELYALDGKGRLVATLRVPGAANVDWEDLAPARSPEGRALWIGDIGDNRARRPYVTVYRIPEPLVWGEQRGRRLDTGTARAYRLSYPGGPRDAETLMATPAGRLYVVTKNPAGSTVFAAPARLREGVVNPLVQVGAISFFGLPSSAGGLKEQVSRLLATGGAISPDGRRLVVRTYTDAYVWSLPGGNLPAGLKATPRHLGLPKSEQGEAIAFTRDGAALLTSSEGKHAPVHSIALAR